MTEKLEYSAADMASAAAGGWRDGQRAAAEAAQYAPVVQEGWQFERTGNGDIIVRAEGVGGAVVSAEGTALRQIPEVILYHLAETLLAAAPAQPAVQGEFGDAYQGSREDLAIWKRRALEAEARARHQVQIIDRLAMEAQGETRMGEPVIPAAHDQGEAQRLRALICEAYDDLQDWRLSFPDANSLATDSLLKRIEAALAASTGQEVEK